MTGDFQEDRDWLVRENLMPAFLVLKDRTLQRDMTIDEAFIFIRQYASAMADVRDKVKEEIDAKVKLNIEYRVRQELPKKGGEQSEDAIRQQIRDTEETQIRSALELTRPFIQDRMGRNALRLLEDRARYGKAGRMSYSKNRIARALDEMGTVSGALRRFLMRKWWTKWMFPKEDRARIFLMDTYLRWNDTGDRLDNTLEVVDPAVGLIRQILMTSYDHPDEFLKAVEGLQLDNLARIQKLAEQRAMAMLSGKKTDGYDRSIARVLAPVSCTDRSCRKGTI